MKTLREKTALITGSGRGIGRAVALAFARRGTNLILCSRTRKELKETEALAKRTRVKILVRPCDVTDAAQIKSLVAAGVKVFKHIDILVNNAGHLGNTGPLVDASERDLLDGLRGNAVSVFLMTREVLKHSMLKSRSGCVINVSSGRGRRGGLGLGPYTAGKFALEGLTQTYAAECKDKGIRVYSLDPMATRTSMRATTYPQEDPNTLKTPEAVAEAFLALAMEDCSIPTGSALTLDRATGRLLPLH